MTDATATSQPEITLDTPTKEIDVLDKIADSTVNASDREVLQLIVPGGGE